MLVLETSYACFVLCVSECLQLFRQFLGAWMLVIGSKIVQKVWRDDDCFAAPPPALGVFRCRHGNTSMEGFSGDDLLRLKPEQRRRVTDVAGIGFQDGGDIQTSELFPASVDDLGARVSRCLRCGNFR